MPVALPVGPTATSIIGSVNTRNPKQQDPNELIAKQFAETRKAIAAEKAQAVDELRAQSGRQQALTGMSGGTAQKAYSKQLEGLEKTFLGAEKDVAAQEAAAKLQESQFSRSQAQQQEQFAQQMGLSRDQLAENARQFNDQLKFTLQEFGENQKTNFWNTMINLQKTGGSFAEWNQRFAQYERLSKGELLPKWDDPVWRQISSGKGSA